MQWKSVISFFYFINRHSHAWIFTYWFKTNNNNNSKKWKMKNKFYWSEETCRTFEIRIIVEYMKTSNFFTVYFSLHFLYVCVSCVYKCISCRQPKLLSKNFSLFDYTLWNGFQSVSILNQSIKMLDLSLFCHHSRSLFDSSFSTLTFNLVYFYSSIFLKAFHNVVH